MNEHAMLNAVLVYLAAAVVCVPLASRFKLGSVLGYLAAGCVIGPFGLRLVGDPAQTLQFAEIGVVLMLFLIGLELDPAKLWRLRRPVFGGGGLQLVTCAAAIALLLGALGLAWKAALVAGLALALSSTAVAMQTMAEKNLLRTPVGQSSFAVLLFQDLAAIPLLALVPLLAEASSTDHSPGWVGTLRVLGAVVVVFVIGRFLTRPLLRMVAGTGLREVFTAFTLLLVLGVALLMASAGASMALGAFLAGVLLASSEYRHALETDIEPFKGLLMGLFFIAMGMSVDFALLWREPLLVLGLVVGYQCVKAAVLGLIAPSLGIGARSRWLFAALLAQGGEFAFVVFGVDRSARVLPGTWDARLTLVVALSMALTPVLLMAERYWARRTGEIRPDDVIADEGAQVILAGFGRFGQIVGRVLFASGIKATVLDHDPELIDVIRRFDFRVYYGDAARIDLLAAAGAARAQVIINAIDDPETSVRLVEAVQEHFPGLQIVARARNVGHYTQLRQRGVSIIQRETFESALLLGRQTLELLGVGPYEARERADRFRRQNVRSLEEILPHWDDVEKRLQMARSARVQLEEQMHRERTELAQSGRQGWHSEERGADRKPAS